MRHVNLRQLEAFRAVRETGSTTRAAQRMCLTQSTVSRLVLQLEEHVGYRLFDRDGGSLTLTPAGLDVYEVAERIMGEVERIERMARNVRQRSTRTIRLSAMPAIGTCMMPKPIRAFLDAHPTAHVTVELKTRAEVQLAVREGRCDLGLVTLPLSDDGLTIEPLCEVETVCILPPGHPLAARAAIALADLAGERLISISTHTILRYRIEDALNAAGVTLSSVCEAESTILVANLVAEGAGVAVVHRAVAEHLGSRVVARPLTPKITLGYGTIERAGIARRALVGHFVDTLRETLSVPA